MGYAQFSLTRSRDAKPRFMVILLHSRICGHISILTIRAGPVTKNLAWVLENSRCERIR